MKILYVYFVNSDLGQIKIQQDLEICVQLLATDRQKKKTFRRKRLWILEWKTTSSENNGEMDMISRSSCFYHLGTVKFRYV